MNTPLQRLIAYHNIRAFICRRAATNRRETLEQCIKHGEQANWHEAQALALKGQVQHAS